MLEYNTGKQITYTLHKRLDDHVATLFEPLNFGPILMDYCDRVKLTEMGTNKNDAGSKTIWQYCIKSKNNFINIITKINNYDTVGNFIFKGYKFCRYSVGKKFAK